MRRWLVRLAPLLLIASLAPSQDVADPVHHVSRAIPVVAPTHEVSAERPREWTLPIAQPAAPDPTTDTNTWQLLATLPGTILHDIAFPTAKIGYAAGEHGQRK